MSRAFPQGGRAFPPASRKPQAAEVIKARGLLWLKEAEVAALFEKAFTKRRNALRLSKVMSHRSTRPMTLQPALYITVTGE